MSGPSGNYIFRTSSGGGSAQVGVNSYNHLVNGAFDYQQVGNVAGANGTSTYGFDQWYIKNSLGTNGVLQNNLGTAAINGSINRSIVKISVAPTALQTNGCEYYQVLSNKATMNLYGQTASFAVSVKGLNNVTQVGVQFFYATTEVKLTTSIGAEVLTTVNSSTYTVCSIQGQNLGTSMTTSGVVGVRIRITGVSSGNTYDINNGFDCEQAILNLGASSASFSRQYPDPVQELAACQYFYQKSYSIATAPGTATFAGAFTWTTINAAANSAGTIFYKVPMRSSPSMSFWDGVGAASRYSTTNGSNATTNGQTASAGFQSGNECSVQFNGSPSVASQAYSQVQWVADARI